MGSLSDVRFLHCDIGFVCRARYAQLGLFVIPCSRRPESPIVRPLRKARKMASIHGSDGGFPARRLPGDMGFEVHDLLFVTSIPTIASLFYIYRMFSGPSRKNPAFCHCERSEAISRLLGPGSRVTGHGRRGTDHGPRNSRVQSPCWGGRMTVATGQSRRRETSGRRL